MTVALNEAHGLDKNVHISDIFPKRKHEKKQ